MLAEKCGTSIPSVTAIIWPVHTVDYYMPVREKSDMENIAICGRLISNKFASVMRCVVHERKSGKRDVSAGKNNQSINIELVCG